MCSGKGGAALGVELRKPSGTWWVASVLAYGQRYGGGYDPAATPFRVALLDRRGRDVAAQEALRAAALR